MLVWQGLYQQSWLPWLCSRILMTLNNVAMNTLKIDVAIVESSMAILQEIKNVSIDVQPLLEYPKGSIPFNR